MSEQDFRLAILGINSVAKGIYKYMLVNMQFDLVLFLNHINARLFGHHVAHT